MADSRFCSYFYLFCITILVPTCCHCHLRSPDDHVPLFIFGDSLFDPGNNNYLKNAGGTANFWPFGETFFKHPTGRFSDGRIIPDFIAGYLKLPLIPPYLQPGDHQFTDGANFASGGAGVLDEILPGMAINLRTQLSYFRKVEKQLRQKKPGVAETKLLLSKAIYLFCIGTNDYIVPFVSNSTVLQSRSKKEYVGTVIGNLTAVIEEIYKIGGRKFGFLNLGPYGCSPYVRAMKQLTRGCADEVTTLVKLHNREFSGVLKHLQIRLEGFRYTTFDFYKSLKERMNHPSKYGFKEGKEACCGSGLFRGTIRSCGGTSSSKEFQLCQNASEYVFFDCAHPTENANNQYADLMWSGSADFTKPCNLKTLVDA